MRHFAWGYFILGLIIILSSLGLLLNGPRVWRASVIPEWNGWPGLVLGCAICIIALRTIRRNKNNPKPFTYSDEDVTKAKAELDAIYLREHGELPQKPKPEKADTE